MSLNIATTNSNINSFLSIPGSTKQNSDKPKTEENILLLDFDNLLQEYKFQDAIKHASTRRKGIKQPQSNINQSVMSLLDLNDAYREIGNYQLASKALDEAKEILDSSKQKNSDLNALHTYKTCQLHMSDQRISSAFANITEVVAYYDKGRTQVDRVRVEQVYEKLSLIQGQSMQINKAVQTMEVAHDLFLENEDYEGLARCLIGFSRLLLKLDQIDEAEIKNDKARNMTENKVISKRLQAQIDIQSAQIHFKKHGYNEGLDYLKSAIEKQEQCFGEDNHFEIAHTYVLMSQAYTLLKKISQGDECCQKAIQILEKLELTDGYEMCLAKKQRAGILLAAKKFRDSIAIYKEVINSIQNLYGYSSIQLIDVYERLSFVHKQTEYPARAKTCLKQAKNLVIMWWGADSIQAAEISLDLCQEYIVLKKKRRAKQVFEIAFKSLLFNLEKDAVYTLEFYPFKILARVLTVNPEFIQVYKKDKYRVLDFYDKVKQSEELKAIAINFMNQFIPNIGLDQEENKEVWQWFEKESSNYKKYGKKTWFCFYSK